MRTYSCISILFALVLCISSCEQDTTSASGSPDLRPMAAKVAADAHPALAYYGAGSLHGSFAETIAVMDTDGTDQANIYTAATAGSLIMTAGGNRPSWSPGGDKICFAERTSTTFQALLRKVDVSVSNGKAVGSNASTIYTLPASDSSVLFSQAYCAVASTAKIAFATSRASAASSQFAKLYTISISGGTPSLLYQSIDGQHHEITELCWSTDDSRIAFIDKTTPHNHMIRIIDASTGAMIDSLPMNYFGINSLEWSRSGLNKLAFCTQDTDVGSTSTDFGMRLRYVDPATGSTPTTNGVVAKYPTWSPNNSSLLVSPVILGDSYMKKVVGFTSTTSTFTNTPAVSNIRIRWKR